MEHAEPIDEAAAMACNAMRCDTNEDATAAALTALAWAGIAIALEMRRAREAGL